MIPLMPILMTAVSWVRNLTWKQIGAIFAAVAALLIYRKGKSDQKAKQKLADLKGYVDVRQRTDEAKQDAARRVGALSDDELNDGLRDDGALRD